MRNIVLLRMLLLMIGIELVDFVQAQTTTNVTVAEREQYIMTTYNVQKSQAQSYEQIRSELLRENNQLKGKKISSSLFRKEQKKLYQKYGNIICRLFSDGKDDSWKVLTQELERYQMLSEEKLVSRQQLLALLEAENTWENSRTKLMTEKGSQQEKFEKKDALLISLNREICQILGNSIGRWYITYKKDMLSTFDNMDKYGASYAEAYKITQIERRSKIKRTAILNSKAKNAEKESQFIQINKSKEAEIVASLSVETARRWKSVNSAELEYKLQNKYGLNQSQILLFKKAYGVYVLKEYKILNQHKLSKAEKYSDIQQASDDFCKKVKPLFSEVKYTLWQGWWKYNLEKKMKRKNLK